MPFLPQNPDLGHSMWREKTCRNPEHKPPTMVSLPEGNHTWQCPECGLEYNFHVHKPRL